jgi:hypothetical protein
MELDDLKAAWQLYKTVYYRDFDAKAILADTKRKAKQRDRIFTLQQMARILCGLVYLGLMAAWYRREGPQLANAGLIVMLLCFALMLAGSIILKYRLRESHPELPSEKFLDEERKKIVAQIGLLRRNTTWLLIPCMSGFLTWQIALSHSLQMAVALLVIAAIVSAGVFWFYRWKLRTDLLPELEAIDRDIEYEREHAETWSWSE